MKTTHISLTAGTLLLLFVGSATIVSAQTLQVKPILAPEQRPAPNERPLLKDRIIEAQGEAQETRVQLRDQLKTRLQNADDRNERKEILDSAISDRREMLDKLRDRRHEIISDARTEIGRRIKGHFENILNRLDNAVQKFASILERIDAYLAQLIERGADVTEAEAAIAIAEEAVREASADVDAIHALFEEALESDTPRDYLDKIKEAARTASESIKEAHRAVNAAVKELKEAARALRGDVTADTQTDVDSDNNDTE